MTPRYREALREASRNVWSGTAHTVRWCVLLAFVGSALAWMDAASVRGLVDDAVGYLDSRGATWALQAPGRVSGRACEALNQATGVVRAGAVRAEAVPVTTVALPKAPVPLFSVTPGFLRVVGSSSTGLSVTDAVADRYGLDPPDQWGTTLGSVTVDGVFPYPSDGRQPGLGFAVLAPTPADQLFDQCWVTVWPTDQRTVNLVQTALVHDGLPPGTSEVKLSQVNPSFATLFNGHALFANRLTRWAPAGALLAGCLIGFASVRTRRLEHASALHTGLPKTFVLVQSLVEALSWAVPAAVLGTVAVLVAVRGASAETSQIALIGARPLVAAAAGAVLGTLLAAALVREKQLFSIFKSR